jgi:hypothetical protein
MTAVQERTYQIAGLGKVAEAAGFAAGIAVTLALRSAKRDSPVRADAKQDSPVHVTPIAGYRVERRHDAVYGPKIDAYAKTLPTGPVRDLVLGFAGGATLAPSAAYRIEAKLLGLLGVLERS